MLQTLLKRVFLPLLGVILFITLVNVWSTWAQENVIPLPEAQPGDRSFSQLQELTASDGQTNDNFGFSIAADGNRLLVGAPSVFDHGGAAYVFEKTGDHWEEVARLVSTDKVDRDLFGIAVALSGDTAVVGAPNHGGNDHGTVYVFKRDANGVWSQQHALIMLSLPNGSHFGSSLSMSGNRLVIGTSPQASRAIVFENRDGQSWEYETEFRFLNSIIIPHISGDTLILGANGDDGFHGAAYIYRRSGGKWAQEQRLTASDGASADYFGSNVYLQNGQAFVYAPDGEERGSVYIFEQVNGNWVERQKITAYDTNAGDFFGRSIAADKSTLMLGSYSYTGSVYLFGWDGSLWTQRDKIEGVGGQFGFSSLLLGDAVVSGAPDALYQKGAVYTYRDPDFVPSPTPTSTTIPTESPASATPTTITLPTEEPTSPPTEEATPEAADELLSDGGFDNIASNWKIQVGTGDKIKCNKAGKIIAYSGSCAWMFKGHDGESAKIQQTITSGIYEGDTLVLSGYVNASGAVEGKIKVVVSYTDALLEKSKMTVDVTSETGGYVPLNAIQPLLEVEVKAAVQKVKVQVKNSGMSGKVYYDDLSLSVQ